MTKQHDTGHFSDLSEIAEKLLDILTKKGFTVPTPIQHQIIPGALEGKDCIGIAQTGTGKTLAFGIPMIQRLAKDKGQGLILVPTRELALQVEAALRQVGAPLGMRTAVVIGGVPQFQQVKAIKNNPHIIIATPGRLDDLMNQRVYKLDKVSIIALDEADRMLDVGFLPQIKRILKEAPQDRQTMLFSATMPSSITSLISSFMKMPLRIEIAPQGTSAENIDQEIFVVNKDNKMPLLKSILNEYKTDVVLIFSRTKYGAKKITHDIIKMGHTATEIHSNRSQAQRKAALDGFSNGRFRIMVATDIAARGIDVKQISLVINFDLPENSEDYVHRIGRTGRAGRHGKAISFVTASQKAKVRTIERLIRKSLPIITHPSLPTSSTEIKSFEQASDNERPDRNSRSRPQSSRPKFTKGYSGHPNNRSKAQSSDRYSGSKSRSSAPTSSSRSKYKPATSDKSNPNQGRPAHQRSRSNYKQTTFTTEWVDATNGFGKAKPSLANSNWKKSSSAKPPWKKTGGKSTIRNPKKFSR